MAQGNVTYRLTDGLGSTVALCNGSGVVTDTWTYDVFGAVKTHTGTNGSEFTFTGEQNDPNGLEYLRARYYDSATGRFVSRDPLPYLNRYVYANNNPVNVIDPTGMGGVGAGAGSVGVRALCDQWAGVICVGGIGGGSRPGSGTVGAGGAALLFFLWLANEISGDGAAHADLPSAGGEPSVTPPDPNDPFGQQHNHHLLPQQFRGQFERGGINIDDPDLMVRMPAGNHYLVHGAWGGVDGLSWNAEWEAFFEANPVATSEQIMQNLADMMIRFGLVP